MVFPILMAVYYSVDQSISNNNVTIVPQFLIRSVQKFASVIQIAYMEVSRYDESITIRAYYYWLLNTQSPFPFHWFVHPMM